MNGQEILDNVTRLNQYETAGKKILQERGGFYEPETANI